LVGVGVLRKSSGEGVAGIAVLMGLPTLKEKKLQAPG
jgi:hypothetical protein